MAIAAASKKQRFILLLGNYCGDPIYAVYDTAQKITTHHRVFDKDDGQETVRCLNQLYNIELGPKENLVEN